MARSRSHTRRPPRANPCGVLNVRGAGFGFVQTAEGEFFVPSSKMGGAFDGDVVEVAPLGGSKGHKGGSGAGGASGAASGQNPAARVVRVVERSHDTLVGRYEVAEPFGVVVPEDPRIPYDIFTMRADRPDIEDGSLVRVRIETFPARNTAATGVVEEVIGRADDEDVGVDLIVARHKLETAFSEGALAEARAAVLDEEGALAAGYRDLRDRFTFTIDPVDARDFDDALSLERVSTWGSAARAGGAQSLRQSCSNEASKAPARAQKQWVNSPLDCSPCGTRLVNPSGPRRSEGVESCFDANAAEIGGVGGADGERSAKDNGTTSENPASRRLWRLGVHIADVSHYVPWGSSLDLDARRRATSVYLVDRVIPMLPHELSSDLCSLKPGETRRSMTADLYLDDAGNLLRYELYPALVRSDARLTYDEAQAMLEEGRPEDDDALAWRLAGLSALAKKRAAAREAAGGLDFGTSEAKVRLDEAGRPVAIDLGHKTDATGLVEEAMILANETVARHLSEQSFPSLYRVHEQPAPDNLAALVPVFQEFPWFAQVDAARLVAGDPHAVQQALAASSGRSEGELVSTLLLRSMKRAVYRPENGGHYGLASAAYTHFTSPIRRYPDLVVHRMLKAQLTRRPERFDQEVAALPWIAEHSSDQERVADAAARESQELKIIEYLQRDVGKAFSAVVSGVAAYGLYVRLENTAEGFVPVRSLGREYFAFDPARHSLCGQETGTVYRLGQRVPVVLVAAEPRSRTLDFKPATDKGGRPAGW